MPFPLPGASPDALQQWEAGAHDRRARQLEERERFLRRLWLKCWIQVFVVEWAAIAVMLWSFHTTSVTAGTIAFWSALALGDGGFLFFLVRTWRKAEGTDG